MDLMQLVDELSGRSMLKQILDTVTRQEEHMSALSDSLAQLSSTVTTMRSTYESKLADLQSALDAERAQDAADSQAVADAQAQTNAALAEVQAAASQVDEVTQQISQVQDQAPDDAPTPTTDVESGGGVPAPDAGGTDTSTTDTGAEPAPAPGDPIPSEPVASEPVADGGGSSNPEDETTV